MIAAVDLFAGTGWGVACQRLGIEEHGVELMPEAVATREANGMSTWLRDVWDVLETAPVDSPEFRAALMIASPPCQTFSMAGSGAGRRALDEVIGLIHDRAYLDPAKLRAFGEKHDPRTALVLTPLAYVARHVPTFVVLEQVPTVLPVWEACAETMRRWGYSVWTGNLQAEMYGVPQTRKRAVLIARADGREAKAPTPTHSRYYSRSPEKLDPGMPRWVSMAEALGWGGAVVSAQSVAGEGRAIRDAEAPGFTVTQTTSRVMRSNYGTGHGKRAGLRGERTGDEPAPTMTSKANRNMILVSNDRLANSARRTINEPAPTITGGHDSGNRKWVYAGAGATAEKTAGQIPRQLEEPAHTVTGKGTGTFRTVDDSARERVTIEEAAALQSYPPGFVFAGSKGKQFLQVGNAVPPLLAEAILREVLS